MAILLPSETKRMYSWWGDSHISPKSSKWLQENLTDMDSKVKAMTKLIEEDADSFARRAEMYYKKRPELMKLVEEFYRAYRALAGRYDHATGALRQAHRTMAEAFPNHIPLGLSDESPSNSSGTDMEPRTPEMPAPIRALFDPDDLQKDAMGMSSSFHVIKRNGAFPEEDDTLTSRRGLKQLKEMFATGEGESRTNIQEEKVRKGLHFQEEERTGSAYKIQDLSRNLPIQKSGEKEGVHTEIKCLQEQLLQLSTENQNLKNKMATECERLAKVESEGQGLKDSLSKLNLEKETVLLQYEQSRERISLLDSQISQMQQELKNLNDELTMGATKLSNMEERCILLEKTNQSLLLEQEKVENITKMKQEELDRKQLELERLNVVMKDERERFMKTELALESMDKSHSQSQEELINLSMEIQEGVEKLKGTEMKLSNAEEQCHLLEKAKQSLLLDLEKVEHKAKIQQEELNQKQKELEKLEILMKDEHGRCLKTELALQSMEKLHSQSQQELNLLSMEIQRGVDKLTDVEVKNISLEEELYRHKDENSSLTEQNMSYNLKLKELQDEMGRLKEIKGKLEYEARLHTEENKALLHELEYLKGNKTDQELRYQSLTVEMEVTTLNVESLQASVGELNGRIVELTDICSKLQDENKVLQRDLDYLKGDKTVLEQRQQILMKETEAIRLNEQSMKASLKQLNDRNVELLDIIKKHEDESKVLQHELDCLKHDKHDLEQRHHSLTEEIEVVRLDTESLQVSIKELHDRNEELKEICKKYENENRVLHRELDYLREDRSDLKQRHQSLTEEMETANLNLESLCALVKELQDGNIDLKEFCKKQMDANKTLQNEHDNLKDAKNDIEQRHQRLAEEMEAVSSNVESLQALVKELHDGNIDLKEICKKQEFENKSLQNEHHNLEDAKKDIEQRHQRLKEEMEAVNSKVESLQALIKELHDIILEQKEACKNHEGENKVLQNDLCYLKDDKSNLEERHASLTEKMEELILNAETLELSVKELLDRNSELEEICKRHEDENLALQHELQNLKDDKNDIEQSHQSLTDEMEAVRLNAESFQALVKQLHNENVELKQICKQNEDDKTDLEQKHQSLTKGMEAVSLNVESLQALVKELQDRNEELRDICWTHEDENKILYNKLNSLEDDKKDLEQRHHSLMDEMDALSLNVESLKVLVKELNVENADLKEICKQLEEESKALQYDLDYLKDEKNDVDQRHQILNKEMEAVSLNVETLQALAKEHHDGNVELKEICKQHEDEKKALQHDLDSLKDEHHELEQRHQRLTEEIETISLNVDSLQRKLHDRNIELKEICEKHEDEKKALEQEFDSLKEDRNTLEKKHQSLKEEMVAVNLNVESLQALVKELHCRNAEHKEICKKHEDEKMLLLENLKDISNVLGKSLVLKNSFGDSNVELDGVREITETIQGSYEVVHVDIAADVNEKSVMVSQAENIAQNLEKLVEKNAFLQNSLSDLNSELEGLRGKMKSLEETRQSLYDEKVNLLSEKNYLILQVESTTGFLKNLESRYAELEGKHICLEREKSLALSKVMELEDFLKLENEQHEALIFSSESRLATLENHINVLQEKLQVVKEEVEMEQQKVMSALLEIFILQRCLSDLEEMNLILSKDCQEHLEAAIQAEKLVSRLEQEEIIQKENMMSLCGQNEKLRGGILLLLRELGIDTEYASTNEVTDESLLQIVFTEINKLKSYFSDAQDEILHLTFDTSVIVTLLKQMGFDLKDLIMEKVLLEGDLGIAKEELLILQCTKQELLKGNEHLRHEMMVRGLVQEEMKVEIENLHEQLSDSRGAHFAAQTEIRKLVDENLSLSAKASNLREQKDTLEEENSLALSDAMTFEHLYVLFKSFNNERALELKLCNDDMYSLRVVRSDLDREARVMCRKISMLEVENMQLKESVSCLAEYRNHFVILQFELNGVKFFCDELNCQIETGKKQLIRREMELSEVNQKVQSMQDKNRELTASIVGLNQYIDRATIAREEMEKKVFCLSEDLVCKDTEIVCVSEANEKLYGELEQMKSEVELLSRREEYLSSKLQREIDEVSQCEVEIMMLLSNIQISSVSSAIFEEKVYELILICESLEICIMLQREVLNEAVTSKDAHINELKEECNCLEGENRRIEANMSEYLPFLMSLWDGILSLEGQIISLASSHSTKNQEKQDVLLSHQHHDDPLIEDPTTIPRGISELQKLIVKVGALRNMITDIDSCLNQERLNAKTLDVTREQIEGIGITGDPNLEEVKTDMLMQLNEKDEDLGTDHRLKKVDGEIAKMNSEHIMKDIQLDQLSSSTTYGSAVDSYGLSSVENAEAEDQMLELWEVAERDCKQMQKMPGEVLEHDIEAVEEEKSEYPSSELVAEKELSVYSHEVGEPRQEQRTKVIERLALDAQRLAALQASIQELKRKMDDSEKCKHPKDLECVAVKEKLNETEGSLLELIGINSKLTKKAEDCPECSDGTSVTRGAEKTGGRQISERARRVSEKVESIELELQKIQYILLKLEEEHEATKIKSTDRRPRALLRDYIYGRRRALGQKKGCFCGCIKPKTNDG